MAKFYKVGSEIQAESGQNVWDSFINQVKNPKELGIYNEKPVEVQPIVTEHKVEAPVAPTPSKQSWYNYIQPAFNKKRDDDVKTY